MADTETTRRRERGVTRAALRIALLYVVSAAVWIFVSDLVLQAVPIPRGWVTPVSIAKGWSFVILTGLLLYVLLRRHALALFRAECDFRLALQHAEEQKRLFFQNTVAAITEGKLLVREPGILAALLPAPVREIPVSSAADTPVVRRAVRDAVAALGFPDERVGDFVVAVGEAVVNTVKHAGGGSVTVHRDNDHLWARVADHGPGINDLMLPRAVLERGYSTKPSLGMGYTLMLALTDRIYLTTGPEGTTVVLELARTPRLPGEMVDAIEVAA